uniref:RING-type E3 ubiquitin transferase n=1 Tax=Meleagris gallopavo TaxID=9103 RepID=A0A803Y6D4_MELGA
HCDACLKGNFRGRRYKCLICYDYDLCATCYESGATTTRHTTDHPMQCILTRVDFGNAASRTSCPGPSGWLPFLPMYRPHLSAWCHLQTCCGCTQCHRLCH